ncbi:unnamed protein product [Ilex paraguariensis]|uniref:Uncharacterized protein n=1 Tax=Ilex paraguariensis TaxID=185542 RepID=A0ABC8RU39_9AQUA
MESQRSVSEIELAIEIPIPSINPTTGDHRHHVSVVVAQRSLSSILTKFHAGYFRISLSLGGLALLWKTLLEPTYHSSTILRHMPHVIYPTAVIVLWSSAFLTLVRLSLLYILRCFFRFSMVKKEFLHHVGVNYQFAPWISWLLLLQSAPFVARKNASYQVLWWVFAVPIVVLDVKIYGQWFTKGKRFLTAVANPTSQISVIGNLVGASAASQMGWQEVAVCFFSLGMVHYLVLFVTLYQRLSGGDRLPAMLRPLFFLFFAAPSIASLAWDSIAGTFDTASKMLFFLSLFLFASLICRPALFKKSMRRYNVAWWAYSFPITELVLASTRYAQQVNGRIAQAIMLILSVLSVLVAAGLVVFTALNTKMLLPDDDPILTLPIHSPRAT